MYRKKRQHAINTNKANAKKSAPWWPTYWPQLATIGTQRAANDEHGHEVATNGYILTRAISEKVRGAKVGARQKPGKGQSQRVLKFHLKSTSKSKNVLEKGHKFEKYTTGT